MGYSVDYSREAYEREVMRNEALRAQVNRLDKQSAPMFKDVGAIENYGDNTHRSIDREVILSAQSQYSKKGTQSTVMLKDGGVECIGKLPYSSVDKLDASSYNININTDNVIDTVNRGVRPNLENIRDYVDKIPGVIARLPAACQCAATYAAVDGMSHFHSKVANHVENMEMTGKNMVEIAQSHADLDAKLAKMSYH